MPQQQNTAAQQQASSRRHFLAQTAAGAVASATLSSAGSARAAGANERLRVGVIGLGGQGSVHLRSLLGLRNVEVAYLCDPDKNRLGRAAEQVRRAEQGRAAQSVADLRKVLDDPSLDAVTIATPDHWHAPAAILAIQAGKHVYVEKPCSHNIREGRLLLEAAGQHNKVVQHGTQTRSSAAVAQAVQMLREGVIGEVYLAKAWNVQKRRNIGHGKPSQAPKHLDYHLWIGPAQMTPFYSNRLHYNWHWFYNTGTGDIGNDGVHELDYALWGLGVSTHPSRISALGGKYFFNDDQEFPDTMQVAYEWPGDGTPGGRKMLVFEMRLWSTNYPENVDNGVEYLGTKGRMFLSKRGKCQVFAEWNKPQQVNLQQPISSSVASHLEDFLDCIRSGGVPKADIAIAHRSATVAHLGNIATRLGQTLQFDPQKERFEDQQANHLLSRVYRDQHPDQVQQPSNHWAVPQGV